MLPPCDPPLLPSTSLRLRWCLLPFLANTLGTPSDSHPGMATLNRQGHASLPPGLSTCLFFAFGRERRMNAERPYPGEVWGALHGRAWRNGKAVTEGALEREVLSVTSRVLPKQLRIMQSSRIALTLSAAGACRLPRPSQLSIGSLIYGDHFLAGRLLP